MTSTDDILALAARAAPSGQAEADLARFAEAVTRGADSDAVRALRALRPVSGGAAALPDSAAWRAWLMAAAATAAPRETAAQAETAAAPRETAAAPRETTARFVVCAAASALDGRALAGPADDRLAAVAAGTKAAELVETVLIETVLAESVLAGAGL